MHANRRRLLLAAVLIGAAPSAFANVITDWDEKAIAVVTPMVSLSSTNPHRAQRMMGMVHAAMFDAINSIEQRYRPYRAQLPADSSTSKEAAAAAAHLCPQTVWPLARLCSGRIGKARSRRRCCTNAGSRTSRYMCSTTTRRGISENPGNRCRSG